MYWQVCALCDSVWWVCLDMGCVLMFEQLTRDQKNNVSRRTVFEPWHGTEVAAVSSTWVGMACKTDRSHGSGAITAGCAGPCGVGGPKPGPQVRPPPHALIWARIIARSHNAWQLWIGHSYVYSTDGTGLMPAPWYGYQCAV